MVASKPTGVLVLGMHRSGTSALAGVLGKLGIPLGGRLLEPGSDNPKGYWEHRDVVAVHERLLDAIGSRWDDIRAFPDGWASSQAATDAAAAIEEIVLRDFAGEQVWAVKDPRLCRFLPLWLAVLARMKVRPALLFIARDPAEVAASIAMRNQWAAPLGEILWLRYMSEAVSASAQEWREMIIFEDLLADPMGVTHHALERLDVKRPRQSSPTMLAEIRAFVDSADRHHRRTDSNQVSGFATIAHRMYVAMKSIARGKTEWDRLKKFTGDFHSRCGRESALGAAADMAMTFASVAQGRAAERDAIASQFAAQVTWSDQAVKKHEALQAENAELASKLAAQVKWSDEAVKEREVLQAQNAELASKLNGQVAWAEEWVKKHEALQTENAELASKLTAQVTWSDQAVKEREVLQAQNAELASKLNGQMAWAEEWVKKHGALQTENVELASKLAAQVKWSDEAVKEREVLQAQNAELASKLNAQLAWADEWVKKHESLQAVAAELSSKLNAQLRWAADAQADREMLRAEVTQLTTELVSQTRMAENLRIQSDAQDNDFRDLIGKLQVAESENVRVRDDLSRQTRRWEDEQTRAKAEIGEAQHRISKLASELDAVYASTSWKFTRRLRALAGLFSPAADRQINKDTTHK